MNFPVTASKPTFTLVFLFVLWLPLLAQDAPMPLRSVLAGLEKKYGVSFTYADQTISGLTLAPPATSLDLPAALAYLQQQTGLVFQQLDDRFITISRPATALIDVCGYLIDADDRGGIAGATVSTGNRHTVSNHAGYFTLKSVPADSSLLIRMLGYETLRLPAGRVRNSHGCPEFTLSAKATRLNEVLIRNYLTAGISKQVNGTFKVNPDELGILPGLTEPDVLHTLQALPGIQSINETVSDINVRGGTNDQNLVLWDGIKMYQTGHFFGLISAFNPYLNKEVTLIKNGASAIYSDGVSSIIDIRSDNTLSKKFTGGAGVNMINADAFFKIPVTQKLTLQLSGRRALTDLLKTPVFSNYFERAFGDTDVTRTFPAGSDTTFNTDENFYFYDIGANLLYAISPKDKLRVHFLHIFNALKYQENIESPAINDAKTSSLTQQSLAADIFYQRLWHNKLRTSAQLYVSDYALRATNYDVLNNQRLIQENEVLDIGVKLDALWRFNNSWDLLSGYQFQEVGVGNLEDINNPEFRRYVKRVIRTHVAFSEVNYKSATGNTTARLGVRANYFPKFNRVIVEPRLAVSQQLYKYFTLELLGEFRSQSATQVIDLQNDFLGVEKRRWILANEDDIPLVISRQASLGAHFNKNQLLVSVEGFYKFVDGITSSSQGFQNQFQYIRASGSYTVSGVEVLVNKQFSRVSAWAGYTYADNRYRFPAFTPATFANNLDITHTATLGVNVDIKQLELSAGLNWRTGKPYTLPTGVVDNQIVYGTPNSVRLPDYLRVDFSARYNFKLGRKVNAQVGGAVWNLTNNQNIFNLYYQLDTSNNIREVQQLALGITPNLMLRISF